MAEHLRRDVPDPLAAEFGVPFEVDAPPEVEQYQRPAVVHRQCEAVAADARFRPQGAVDGLAQHDRHVFHRVVFVDIQVAVRLHRERHPAVVGDLGQHVIQEPQPGGNPVARGAAASRRGTRRDVRARCAGAVRPISRCAVPGAA